MLACSRWALPLSCGYRAQTNQQYGTYQQPNFRLTVYLANALSTIIGEEIHPATLFGLMLIIAGLVIQQIKWGRKRPRLKLITNSKNG